MLPETKEHRDHFGKCVSKNEFSKKKKIRDVGKKQREAPFPSLECGFVA